MFDTLHFQALAHGELAYRVVGRGEPLLLVHGYPLSGLTYRHVVPLLAEHFTCYIPDLLGAGETRWRPDTDFSFTAQAETLKDFADTLGLKSYSLLAHDTGATIARKLALIDPDRVRHLALIGTEIPGHRPDWIELFQKLSHPDLTLPFRLLLRSRRFRESSACFGGCFHDTRLMHGEFHDLQIAPVAASAHRTSGLIRYLKGIDWQLVDRLKTEHARITAPTLLVWGEEDTVFPVERAREMVGQLGNCQGFVTVPKARLFVQEEHPETVARLVREFMVEGKSFPR